MKNKNTTIFLWNKCTLLYKTISLTRHQDREHFSTEYSASDTNNDKAFNGIGSVIQNKYSCPLLLALTI